MSYEDLERKIRHLILNNIEYGKLSIIDGAAIAHILFLAKDENTLKTYVKKLSQEFIIFDEIFEDEKTKMQENLEQIVQNFVENIIKDDPLLATQISTIALNKNVSFDELKQKFPQFAEYLSKAKNL
ncbi:MAG: hypothetical protein UR28_C0023G0008 [Candidatus Peregrinibacteria bacterium GW2011_GWF2_33_10]|nr:MAG: hypothetical protein UR28_C0023G0008 [Candidatus Peregrinibacteria bacterium GW2011_GWF2_33_10]OGJ45118.1 MAG: hypothetical protein A2263_05185 [Candidatus Peregrinibacteria bacterium RIFOXYA2_FULL_33_21]OGJ50787.1 MAG: hypothetical protein A2307_01955 [Candidatus Peregrinibacteria bacterium RIFOXYB2_FULL_33_20]